MFTKTSLLVSLCASSAYAAFTPPQRLDVPVILSNGGRPMFGVGMGTQGAGTIQGFNFTLTTSLGYTAVANQGCSDCNNTPLYDMSLSPDARSLSGQSAVSLGAGSFGGGLMKENCTLKTNNGHPWSYTNQTVIRMNDTSTTATPFVNGISGLVGLGTLKNPTNATGFSANFYDSLYGQYYIRNPEAVNFTFGMALSPSPVIPGNSSTQLSIAAGGSASSFADQGAGTIHWLQPDPSAYDASKVTWRTVEGSITSGYLPRNQQPDLTVQLNGWSAKIGNTNVGNGAGILVNLDPYYSGIYLPGSQALLIHDAISGSQLVQMSTIPGETVAWEVPCDTKIQFTVTVDSQQFTVDQSLLVQKLSDNTCISIIEGFTDESVTQYIFGQSWISQLYIIFNIPKDGSASVAFAPRSVSSSESRDIGAIVGGTVGGVAGVVALGLLGFYCIRRRQDNSFFKRAAALEEEHKVASNVEPFTIGQAGVGHRPSLPATPYGSGMGIGWSPPVSPQFMVPLLDTDAGPLPHLPPSYEEASENGSSSLSPSANAHNRVSSYPFEKGGYYRRDTVRTTLSSIPPSPNNQSAFGGSASSAV
ncbi:acid protease [Ganoderma leucocontextum]|nr:acid protease [Ganoderma leucocontextum]